MSEGQAGPSNPNAQRNKFYKRQDGGGRGRGGGQSQRGGRGRGGGDRGRGGSGGPSRGGGSRGRGESASGPYWQNREGQPQVNSHLGRYRDDPLPEYFTSPGLCVTTVLNKERAAERELVEYLEEVVDQLYPETIEAPAKEDEIEDDFEAALQRELKGLSDKKSSRFRLCRHDTSCVIYINTLPPLDPIRIVRHILETVEHNAKCPFKFIRRLTPISACAGATLPQLTSLCQLTLEEGFKTPDNRSLRVSMIISPSSPTNKKQFAVHSNTRSSAKLERLQMIQTVADQVVKLSGQHKVDLTKPERTILLELYKNSLGMSVVQDYDRFRKFNVHEVASAEVSKRHNQMKAQEEVVRSGSTGVQDATAEGGSAGPSRQSKGTEQKKRKLGEIAVDEPATSAGDSSSEIATGPALMTGGEPSEAEEVVDVDGLRSGVEEVIQAGRSMKVRKTEEDPLPVSGQEVVD